MKRKCFTPCMLLAVVLAAGPSARQAAAVANEKTPTRQPAPQVSTAQGTIDLAGILLRKGDAREAVMRKLSRLYVLQKCDASREKKIHGSSRRRQTHS